MKLVKLKPDTKQPRSNDWRNHIVTRIDPKATGYGLLLDENSRCSIDPDDIEKARIGLHALGFDLEAIMQAGVRTISTRPGSGGRSMFVAPKGVRRVTFNTSGGTALELLTGKRQDVIPGLRYFQRDGSGPFTQHYANGATYADERNLPPEFVTWWQRMSTDDRFRKEQQRLFACACGDTEEQARQAVHHCDNAPGAALPFQSPLRVPFNKAHRVEDILAAHGYTTDGRRWAPPTATGTYGVRLIPGKQDLWQSDHASDPLNGTFDAWAAYVVLDHGADINAATAAQANLDTSKALQGLGEVLKTRHQQAPDPAISSPAIQTEPPGHQQADGGGGKATPTHQDGPGAPITGQEVSDRPEPEKNAPGADPGADHRHPLARYVDLNLGQLSAPEFILDDLIQAGVVVLSGGQGQGKSVQLVSLLVKVAHLCQPDDPLRPRLRRRVIYITEDVEQVKRTLAAIHGFGNTGCSVEDFQQWFKVVPATRGPADRFTEVKPEYLKLQTPNTGKTGTVFMADPLVVVDTKSAVFDIEDENDNAVGSAIVAELKQQFNVPMIIVGHLAKALSRSDVMTMSMRGAGSWEGDVHQTAYLYADETIGRDLRFMHFALPAKRRFENGIDVLQFTGQVNTVHGRNALGETVRVAVRHAECQEVSIDEVQDAKTDAKEARDAERKAKLVTKWETRILETLRAATEPLSKTDVADRVGSNRETLAPAFASLITSGALVADGTRGGTPLWRAAPATRQPA